VSDSALLAHDRARGVRLIAGVDEVGAGGCWAGPIVAAGVLFDLKRLASGAGRDLLEEVNDSKRLAPAKRERLGKAVLAHAEAVSLVFMPASQINRIGLRPANLACLEQALRAVGERAELRFVDGYTLGASAPVHERIVRGDATSATIAAASIVAKVTRDRLMTRVGERYPGYGFERHKGYRTKEHRAAVAKLGPTPEHRLSLNARHLAEAIAAPPARRRKSRRASWRELPAIKMAAYLLGTPTIADRVWTDEPRLPRETRTAFIHRILLRETEPVDVPEGETAATESRRSSGVRHPGCTSVH
jgi:ribonuclease HII